MPVDDFNDQPSKVKSFRSTSAQQWFAVARGFFEHPIVGTKRIKGPWPHALVWLWMVSEAAFQDRRVNIKGRLIHLQRGQFVCSERHLAKNANWTRKAARGFLLRLEKDDMVSLSTATREGQYVLDLAGQKKGPGWGPDITIVTIRNYDVYQFGSHIQGTSKGTSKGPARDQIITRDTVTRDTRESSQSPVGHVSKKEDLSKNASLGTDETDAKTNVVPLRPSMVMDEPTSIPYVVPSKTKQKIEALGCDPEELVDRMHEQIDKGRRIGSKSRYLITSAINQAHERDGTPVETLHAIISGNRFARQAALASTGAAKQEPTEAEKAMRARTTAPRTNASALLASLKR